MKNVVICTFHSFLRAEITKLFLYDNECDEEIFSWHIIKDVIV